MYVQCCVFVKLIIVDVRIYVTRVFDEFTSQRVMYKFNT